MATNNKYRTADGYFFTDLGPVDEYGKPVSRTKSSHPYSYDGFITWRGGENEEVNDTTYSDRLFQQDFRKYDQLCDKHFGDKSQYFSRREPEKIEAFLRDWYNKPKLKLIFIMEYCNVSSGYPLWRFGSKIEE